MQKGKAARFTDHVHMGEKPKFKSFLMRMHQEAQGEKDNDSEEDFTKRVQGEFFAYSRGLEDLLLSNPPNPFDIFQLGAEYWGDAVQLGYIEGTDIEYLVKAIDEVKAKEEPDSLALSVAHQIDKLLNTSGLPDGVYEEIKKARTSS